MSIADCMTTEEVAFVLKRLATNEVQLVEEEKGALLLKAAEHLNYFFAIRQECKCSRWTDK